MSQNLITLLDLCNWRNLDQTTSLEETENHGLAEAKQQAIRQGKGWLKTSRNIDSKYHESLETFPRIRELMESSQPENKTLLRESRLHSGAL